MQSVKTKNWLMAVAGVWVVAAPFILRYSGTAAALWNDLIVGIVVVILAMIAALAQNDSNIKNLDWVNAVLGLWLVLSPFILGYSALAAAMWSDIVAGVVIVVLAVWSEIELPKVVGHAS